MSERSDIIQQKSCHVLFSNGKKKKKKRKKKINYFPYREFSLWNSAEILTSVNALNIITTKIIIFFLNKHMTYNEFADPVLD